MVWGVNLASPYARRRCDGFPGGKFLTLGLLKKITTGWHISLIQNSRWHHNKSSVLAWPALTWPGQNGTFVLMSTGGLSKRDVSPCMNILSYWTLNLFFEPQRVLSLFNELRLVVEVTRMQGMWVGVMTVMGMVVLAQWVVVADLKIRIQQFNLF